MGTVSLTSTDNVADEEVRRRHLGPHPDRVGAPREPDALLDDLHGSAEPPVLLALGRESGGSIASSRK